MCVQIITGHTMHTFRWADIEWVGRTRFHILTRLGERGQALYHKWHLTLFRGMFIVHTDDKSRKSLLLWSHRQRAGVLVKYYHTQESFIRLLMGWHSGMPIAARLGSSLSHVYRSTVRISMLKDLGAPSSINQSSLRPLNTSPWIVLPWTLKIY